MENEKLPKLQTVQKVSDGWVKKYLLTYVMPDGREHVYESVSRKDAEEYRAELEANASGSKDGAASDAVCIVPMTVDGRLVMIKEFRYPLNSHCVGFPAGLLEAGEDLAHAAERELLEETGYALARDERGRANVRALSQAGYSSAGLSAETVQVVYVTVEDEPAREQATEQDELIQVFTLPVGQIEAFLQENTVPIGARAQLILESFANARRA